MWLICGARQVVYTVQSICRRGVIMTFKTGFVFAAAVSLLLASITVAAAARPPNFVLFLADE